MSESTIPFEGQTMMTQAPTTDFEPESGNRAKLLALGGIAAVLALGLIAYFLVFAGGGEEEPTGPVVRKPASSGAAPEAEAPPAQPAKKQRISAKSFGRDPFKALIVEPAVATTTVGSQPAAATPATSTTTTDTATTGSTQPETSVPAASTAHRFKVVDVAPDNSRISVKVDGEFYRNLKAGQVFAEFFKVRFIGGAVNDFQFGEESFKVVGTKAVSIG
jgi:hypothetical protein